MQLTAEDIEALSAVYLSPRYDDASATPDFHREGWALYSSDAPRVALAAPRSHAKSTSFTHDYALAEVLYRNSQYIILLGATEEMAIEHLGEIANELRENEDLIRDFKIKQFVTEQKTDIIVECEDGHQFRLIARGAEQKIRGKKWRGRRPDLIIGDDLEDDELVENRDRRAKFRKWFYRAALQAVRRGGRVRIHGTILHEDSLLASLMTDSMWKQLRYRAHKSFDEFTEILWPERFNEAALREIRQTFINKNDGPGYAQEYLNDPLDYSDKYLQKPWFLGMTEEDHEAFKINRVGVDFAISKADSANRTSFTVGGKCSQKLMHFIDQRIGRWDSLQIIEQFFDVYEAWHPDMFFVENGQIWKAICPMLEREMRERDIYLPITAITPVSDKAVRGRPLQKRMRAGGCRFDKDADWYPGFEDELLRFTGISDAMQDDQFDSAAILVRGDETTAEVEDDDAMDEEELEFLAISKSLQAGSGRSAVTGY